MTALLPDAASPQAGVLDPDAIGVVVVDGSDTVRLANDAAASLLGRTRRDLVGRMLHHLVQPARSELSLPTIVKQVRQGTPWSGALDSVARAAEGLRVDVAMGALSGPVEVGVAIVMVDSSSSAFGRLGWLAVHDPLTGLANRALLADRLQLASARAARRGAYVAVLFLDLDGFKAVNDALGHAEGDRVLVAVAQRLVGLLRPTDTLARYGGDELVAVCEVQSADELSEIVNRLAAGSVVEVRPGWDIRTSIGAAISTNASPAELIRRSDQAMYRAKITGEPEIDLIVEEGPI